MIKVHYVVRKVELTVSAWSRLLELPHSGHDLSTVGRGPIKIALAILHIVFAAICTKTLFADAMPPCSRLDGELHNRSDDSAFVAGTRLRPCVGIRRSRHRNASHGTVPPGQAWYRRPSCPYPS